MEKEDIAVKELFNNEEILKRASERISEKMNKRLKESPTITAREFLNTVYEELGLPPIYDPDPQLDNCGWCLTKKYDIPDTYDPDYHVGLINNSINAHMHMPGFQTDDINDGFHTFGQLYYQRMMLFAYIVNSMPEKCWKTKRHEDGDLCFRGGWFLVTVETPEGAYGYHYKEEYWDIFKCQEIERAKHWDGYTEKDVTRLFSLLK